MRAVGDNILIEVDRRFDDRYETPSGFTLYKYLTSGTETHDVIFKGRVVAVSEKNEGVLNPGDTVYFHYNVLLRPELNVIFDEGNFWRVPTRSKHYPGDVFCRVRDGVLAPVFGWALIEPVKNPGKTNGIIINPFEKPEKSETMGIVRHIGDNDFGLNEGDQVVFSADDAFENNIEGTPYYVMEANRINSIYAI